MNQLIKDELRRIEMENNIDILYAVESGSRAWGFASVDSDYDVRFIYKRPKDFYLRLEKSRDTLEFMLPNDLDVSGWDIDKTLKLLRSSNPSLIEWINSPIVYKTTPEFKLISDELKRCFSVKTGTYHYLSMAKNNYMTYFGGETVSVKKYFYVLRPILAAKYILKTKTPPPVPFVDLMKSELDDEMKGYFDELLAIKMSAKEKHNIPHMQVVDDYIEANIAKIEEELQVLPKEEPIEWDALDKLFCDLIGA